MNQIPFTKGPAARPFLAIAVMTVSLLAPPLHAEKVVPPGDEVEPSASPVSVEVERKTLEGVVTVTYTLRLRPERPPLLQPLASESGLDCPMRYEAAVEIDARLSLQGFLMEPRFVICEDLDIDAGYVSSIEVSRGDEKVPATLARIFKDRKAVGLVLEKPIDRAVPLGPIAEGLEARWAVETLMRPTEGADIHGAHAREALDGIWSFTDGAEVRSARGGEVLFDEEGAFCGLRFGWHDANGSPDPGRWPSLSAAELPAAVIGAQEATARSVFPVILRFRSPKKEERLQGAISGRGNELTEYKTFGTLVSAKRLLVGISGARSAIPRLERITVFLPDGTSVDASFAFVHKRTELLAADLPEPCPGKILEPSPGDVTACRGRLAWLVRSTATGAGRLDRRAGHFRPGLFDRMWRDRPELEVHVEGGLGDYAVMTPDGKALWKRVAIRPFFADVGDGSDGNDKRDAFLPARDFIALATPGEDDVDSVRPVHADEDGAIGWIGLDFQPMDHALAEELGVLAETDDGTKGAIVSRVVPGSVSSLAGIRPGWILLTIRGPGMEFPSPVSLSEEDDDLGDEYPWGYFDEMPVELLERLPMPWPKVNTPITRALFAMGIGREITATFRVDGAEVVKKLVIEGGPRYFGNAPAYRWDAGGMTVCELTAEVRDYLNLELDAPGVVVSRMESSGRAAIAGIRRFEVIRKVNGESVTGISGFEKAVKGLPEVKFDVLRRSDTRVVRVTSLPDGDVEGL